MRLRMIIDELEALGDLVNEHKAVLKVLRTVPRLYNEMAMAIELLVDTKTSP